MNKKLDSINNAFTSNLKTELENVIFNTIEKQSERIVGYSKYSIENIINPFSIKVDNLKSNIEKFEIYEIEKNSSLLKELDNLKNLNNKLTEEANNLTQALKGNHKLQGLWGELTIKRIFEHVGMIEGLDYSSQKQFNNGFGKKIPDYVVNLPNNKHIIIDAKTSLGAYEKYYNSNNESDKKIYLREHIANVKKHIDELNIKDYSDINNLNQTEYILMFIPIEGAFSVVIENKMSIISYAYSKNIFIVTPSTILVTMKTIEYVRRQEHQNKNVAEIIKQSGILYDKFVSFADTLIDVDKKILETKNKIQDALKKLSLSDKYGHSIISRVKKLKDFGIVNKKDISNKF
ncbi:MAG: DNA recombination protein RmuC [Endomicrobium sp.]|jgi:DNA recombination protein RmuC|nr:DNA recombination protein RmuC [Endomicrobium sp.]